MSLFKCKICGGTLDFIPGTSVCECQYCGTRQTLPKTSSERSTSLYDRADHFRRNNDFDKAISIYEQILNEDNTDAEAYWSLVLCRYGVEYVEDPKSNKRIATVNRMQFTSVLADEDYKSAVKYADPEQKEIYEAEAKEIDSIQKGILAISQKEAPFDIFICYKETDHNGRRTPDSVLANELYHQLTNEGYKVFFSRITLEDKLGTAYEPYIFAALNSAKVMVVIGTKPEYFNAVWVKNEWSRFLALTKNGANKVLIPAYRDMDPYDLPEEFSHLQAQDMAKLGFMQDLIRGIEKLISTPKTAAPVIQPIVQNPAQTAPLLRRVFLFLEDADWTNANEYCEKVLDAEPENGEAYLGKLMADLHVRRRENLGDLKESFENNRFYAKVVRFGDEKLVAELNGYLETIAQRAERARLMGIYKNGEALMISAKTAEDYQKAAAVFASISGFEDADEKANICKNKADEVHFVSLYAAACALMHSAKTEADYIKAGKAFEAIRGYQDAEKLSADCVLQAETAKKDAIYAAALSLLTDDKAMNYQKAIAEFEKIPGWKDSGEKVEHCRIRIEEIDAAATAAALALKQREEEAKQRAEARKEAAKKRNSTVKKVSIVVIPLLLLALVVGILLWNGDFFGLTQKDSSLSQKPTGSGVTENPEEPTEPTEGSMPTEDDEPTEPTATDGNEPTEDSTPTTPQPTEPEPSEPQITIPGLKYKVLDNGTAEITGYEGNATTLKIPSQIDGYPVTSIGDYAFYGCHSLTSITIPYGVTSIGMCSFFECEYLTDITIPDTVNRIGDGAFNSCKRLVSIVLPEGLTSIGYKMFCYCNNLISIEIPDGVTNIGGYAFFDCASLTGITIPDGVKSIGDCVFSGCGDLTGITIPDGVKSIGDGAFSGCDDLTGFTIPDSVTSIGDSAFYGCDSLTSVTIPDSVTSIGEGPFAECANLIAIHVENGNPKYSSDSRGVLFNKDQSILIQAPGALSGSYAIPDSVTSIGDSAFWCCTRLTNVTIGNSVTNIGYYAFWCCTNLTSITIPDSVTSIDNLAFQYCDKIDTVYFKSEAQKEKFKSYFYGCELIVQ